MRNVPGVLARRQVAPTFEPARKEVIHMEELKNALDSFILFFALLGFSIICIL